MARKPIRTEYHGTQLSMSQLRYGLGISWHTLASMKASGRLNERELDVYLRRALKRAQTAAAAAEKETV